MGKDFSIPIARLVQHLGLEIEPRTQDPYVVPSFNVRCPFCSDRGYHMNISNSKNTYHCLLCSGDDKNTGVLDLYGRVRLGVRVEPGRNSKELFVRLKEELGEDPRLRRMPDRPVLDSSEVLPASPAVLDKTYSTLLSLLPLTEGHFEQLVARGLSEADIRRNGYGSSPADGQLKTHYYGMFKACLKVGLRKEADLHPRLKKLSDEALAAAFAVGAELRRAGCDLDRVPGAFKVAGYWGMLLEPGMLIPTRDMTGRIVGLQVRLDAPKGKAGKPGLRYMTVSSKGLPCGPTSRISRLHFPLGNCELAPDTRVLLTEGPLKADVALSLMSGPCFMVAIQGVNNVRGIADLAEKLTSCGITRIYNALDMDKVTNPNVARGARKIGKILQENSVKFSPMYWARDYAVEKDRQLRSVFQETGLAYPEKDDLYLRMEEACLILDSKQISRGTEERWDKESKGIDDWLLSQKKIKNFRR